MVRQPGRFQIVYVIAEKSDANLISARNNEKACDNAEKQTMDVKTD